MARKASFDEQRLNVVELLRDRGNDLVSGPTIKDFEEMGAHQGDRSVFTAEFIRRHFGVPEGEGPDAALTDEYVEHLRGASHVLLELRLQELKRDVSERDAWGLWQKIRAVFPRDEGAHRDYEYWTKKAKEYDELSEKAKEELADLEPPNLEATGRDPRTRGADPKKKADDYMAKSEELREQASEYAAKAAEIRKDLWLCDRGIDLLTLYCMDDDLFVEFARAQTVREEKRMEERNAEIFREYEAAKVEKKEKDAAMEVAIAHGISTTRVR